MRPIYSALVIAACLAFHPSLTVAQSELAEPPSLPAVAEPATPATSPVLQTGAVTESPEPAPPAPAAIDVAAAPTSLWQRIRNGFSLPDLTGALVREQEEWFVQRPD